MRGRAISPSPNSKARHRTCRMGTTPARRASSIRGKRFTTSRTSCAPTRRVPDRRRGYGTDPERSSPRLIRQPRAFARLPPLRSTRPEPRGDQTVSVAAPREDAPGHRSPCSSTSTEPGRVRRHRGCGSPRLTEHGLRAPDDIARRYWQTGLDGIEHDEQYRLTRALRRVAYASGMHGLSGSCGVERGSRHVNRPLRPRRHDRRCVLRDAGGPRGRCVAEGVVVAVCSNCFSSDREAGLTAHVDVLVSSAWVGARKRTRRHLRARARRASVLAPGRCVRGDTWNCDVDGPARARACAPCSAPQPPGA